MAIYRTQSNCIRKLTKQQYDALREMCRYANNLYNYALYQIRQQYFAERTFLTYESNCHLCKNNENYKLLQAGCSQQVLKLADRAFKSFFNLKKKACNGEYRFQDVRMPGYRAKGGLYVLVFSTNAITVRDGQFLVPMSREFRKAHPGLADIKVPFPERLSGKLLKEVRVLPHGGRHFTIEYCYEDAAEHPELDLQRAMGIDLGVNNLAACVTNTGTAFLVDGRKLKSINRYYNKQLAHYRSIAERQGMRATKRIRDITRKHNRQVSDYMHKAVRAIVDRCLAEKAGTIVCGYNASWKQSVDMGHVENQNFVMIPHGKFRDSLASLCEKYGIRFVLQEESYTSQASFPDRDAVPVYVPGDHTVHTFSGVRVKRGLYRAGNGAYVNADCNAAANILRKSMQESISYGGLGSGALDAPVKVRVS